MKKLLLFINGNLGLQLLDFLSEIPDIKVSAIVLNSENKLTSNYHSKIKQLTSERNLEALIFYHSKDLWKNVVFQNVFVESSFAISALFGHKIPPQVISHFGNRIINLHPSLLPLGRGADPIPWGIIENVQQGVTIHILSEQIDSGPILAQKELITNLSMNAGEIYEYAMYELFNLFKSILTRWLDGSLQSSVQPDRGSTHNSSELNQLRINILEDGAKVEEIVRLINSLTFSDGRNAIFKATNGEFWKIQVLLESTSQLKEKNETIR